MVAVLGKEEDLLEKGKLFTKVVAACCRQNYATGIYTSGVVFEPRFYEGFADMMQNDELPIFNWIWFGLWRDEHGMNGYSYAKRDSTQEGFVPVLIRANDETLWECLIMNSDPDSDGGDDYAFDPDKVAEYRKKMLSTPSRTVRRSWRN
mgnify:CR=1 FL=1